MTIKMRIPLDHLIEMFNTPQTNKVKLRKYMEDHIKSLKAEITLVEKMIEDLEDK